MFLGNSQYTSLSTPCFPQVFSHLFSVTIFLFNVGDNELPSLTVLLFFISFSFKQGILTISNTSILLLLLFYSEASSFIELSVYSPSTILCMMFQEGNYWLIFSWFVYFLVFLWRMYVVCGSVWRKVLPSHGKPKKTI